TFIEATSSAALLTFQRSRHPRCAAETIASRRRTAISRAKEIRQHVFHETGEYVISVTIFVIIVQGNAITDRAPIEDPATIGALPVNHLGYRIHRPYVVEEIVIGVATYITAHNRVHKAPHSERCDLLGGLAGSHCPGLDGRCCPVWGAEAFVQPYML